MKTSCQYTTYICALVILGTGVAGAQEAASGGKNPPAPTLALSPAIAMLRAKPGQSVTQTITIANGLPAELSFTVDVQDVVVRDGKRGFFAAGQVASSIAAAAIASPSSVVAPPGKSVSVNITLTIPPDTRQRAVVAFFKGQLATPGQGSVGFSASLGTLITLNLSDDAKIVSGPITASPQSNSANVGLSQELENAGAEPVVPRGVVAILDDRGRRVAKADFEPHRLLPGERGVFAVFSPTALRPGRYRALASFEYEGKVLTNAGEFTVLE